MKREFPLHITDPADGKRKLAGMKQVEDDGSVIWFKKVNPEHVMRLGMLGFDEGIYDLHFKGRKGGLRVVRGDDAYHVSFADFEQHKTQGDYGHGKQVFLDLQYWTKEKKTTVTEPPKLVFGQSRICPDCDGTGRKALGVCPTCGGTKVVA